MDKFKLTYGNGDIDLSISSLNNVISSILDTHICLIGEEMHWLMNILEKEKLIFDKLISNSPDLNYIVAVEYDLSYTYPKVSNICNEYIEELKNIFEHKAVLKSITCEKGLRGLKMAKGIYKIFKEHKNSVLIAIVGSGHITPSGSEIPTLLNNMLEKDGFYKRFTRIHLRATTDVDDKIVGGFDQFGWVYLF